MTGSVPPSTTVSCGTIGAPLSQPGNGFWARMWMWMWVCHVDWGIFQSQSHTQSHSQSQSQSLSGGWHEIFDF